MAPQRCWGVDPYPPILELSLIEIMEYLVSDKLIGCLSDFIC